MRDVAYDRQCRVPPLDPLPTQDRESERKETERVVRRASLVAPRLQAGRRAGRETRRGKGVEAEPEASALGRIFPSPLSIHVHCPSHPHFPHPSLVTRIRHT